MNGFIYWEDGFSVRIKEFDRDHQQLIQILNELTKNLNEGEKPDSILVIKRLVEFAVVHFSKEEKVMLEFSYPNFVEHRKEHDVFFDKIADFEKRITYRDDKILLEAATFLREWMMNHINKIDKGYSSYLNSKGVR